MGPAGRSFVRPDNGFGLLELLLVLSISSILISGLFLCFVGIQNVAHDICLMADRNRNLWMAPPLFLQWTAAAGNNRWSQAWTGLDLEVEPVSFRADIDGSGGFPDGELSSSYEEISFRLANGNLSVRSGAGSFQPVFRAISSFEVERLGESLVEFRWTSATLAPLQQTQQHDVTPASLKVHLWDYRTNLFEEARE